MKHRHRVAQERTRQMAIKALMRQNRVIYDFIQRCDKDAAGLRERLEAEYQANVKRIEKIELLSVGAAAHAGDCRGERGVTGAGSPRLAEEEGAGEDWRVRVAGVLEDNTPSVDPHGQYSIFNQGQLGDSGE